MLFFIIVRLLVLTLAAYGLFCIVRKVTRHVTERRTVVDRMVQTDVERVPEPVDTQPSAPMLTTVNQALYGMPESVREWQRWLEQSTRIWVNPRAGTKFHTNQWCQHIGPVSKSYTFCKDCV